MTGSLEGVVCGNIGVGAVGSYWARLQIREGAEVLVYDAIEGIAKEVAEDYGCETVSLDELLTRSDWVNVSVLPLIETFNVMAQIKERSHMLKPGSLLLDNSGVKTGTKRTIDRLLRPTGMDIDTFTTAQLKALEGRDDVEAIALHLAFKPDVELEGQNVYISPLKPNEGGLWLPRITKLLTSHGANVYQLTPEMQDTVTMVHQMIIWAALFAAFEAVRQSTSAMSFAEMERLTTKLSKPFFDLMKRMTSGNWRVYWDTMAHHPEAIHALDLIEQNIHQLRGSLINEEAAMPRFEAMYQHLQAIAQSGSPEQKTGKPLMVEIYYEHTNYDKVREALRLEKLSGRGFLGHIDVSMIDGGRINELHRTGIPVASFTRLKHRDRIEQPNIAFYVRNVPHPMHPERKGMRFSPTVPRNLERTQQINPDYTRVQLTQLHTDPIVNFFANVNQDPVLSPLQPFVVYKPL
ncbi:hypothetical protein HYY73_00405 [Candidatus Woesearchaeota archaeon]|nr:hypothetical protein [Candidatus Woesearchaeota archaeon]